MGVLRDRREAIDLVRMAYTDLAEHARITGETTANLRRAHQISELVFSKKISDRLSNLAGRALELDHTSLEQMTSKVLDARYLLCDDLKNVIDAMQSEAALRRWF
jgi:hypothetical protein